jgi:hypothetical protein
MTPSCMLCGNEDEPTRYIDLYIIGSEGLRICHKCEMELVEFARNLRSKNMRTRWEKAKEERNKHNDPTSN